MITMIIIITMMMGGNRFLGKENCEKFGLSPSQFVELVDSYLLNANQKSVDEKAINEACKDLKIKKSNAESKFQPVRVEKTKNSKVQDSTTIDAVVKNNFVNKEDDGFKSITTSSLSAAASKKFDEKKKKIQKILFFFF